MWSKLEEVFEALGLDYSRQGSYADTADYPKSFYTFWNYETENGHYDNETQKTIWLWQIYYYTCDPSTLYSGLDAFIKAAKAAGFVVEGQGYDIGSDRPDYVGRMVTVKWVEFANKD